MAPTTVLKQVALDEYFTQNAEFKPIHMASMPVAHKWFWMNGSHRAQRFGPRHVPQSGSPDRSFGMDVS